MGAHLSASTLDRIATELSAAALSDALDRIGLRSQAMDAAVRPVLPDATCVGYAATMLFEPHDQLADEPYTEQIAAADSLQAGDVAVLATSGISACALWGELFSNAAIGRGARGVVMDGYHRDTRKIVDAGLPVFSIGSRPIDVAGRARVVDWGISVVCGGVDVAPGDLILADVDGVVVVPSGVTADVFEIAFAKTGKENTARGELLQGALIADVWRRHRVL